MNARTGRSLAVAALAAWCIATLAAGGCGGKAGKGAAQKPTAADSTFARLAFQRGRPSADVSLAAGKQVFARYCAVCHGETGGGDGFNAYNVKAAFDVTPSAFSDSAFMATLKDSTALAAIRGGGPAVGKSAAMPPWGRTLGESEIADVWRFARSLAGSAH